MSPSSFNGEDTVTRKALEGENSVAPKAVNRAVIAASKGKKGGVDQSIEPSAAFLFLCNHERTSRLLRKTEVLSSHRKEASNGKKH
jgi:hypothetical protein